MDQANLSTIHRAVSLASVASKKETSMVVASLRLPESIKKDAEAILENNGTNLSTYLRSCCELLINDYKS